MARLRRVEFIPKDFPVRPLKPGENPPGKTTCGHCGLSWDDDIPTTYTPAPSARCPFEAFHIHRSMERDDLTVLTLRIVLPKSEVKATRSALDKAILNHDDITNELTYEFGEEDPTDDEVEDYEGEGFDSDEEE